MHFEGKTLMAINLQFEGKLPWYHQFIFLFSGIPIKAITTNTQSWNHSYLFPASTLSDNQM